MEGSLIQGKIKESRFFVFKKSTRYALGIHVANSVPLIWDGK